MCWCSKHICLRSIACFNWCSECCSALWRRCVARSSRICLFIHAHIEPLILNEKVKTRSTSKLCDATRAKTFSCKRHTIHINHFVFCWNLIVSRESTFYNLHRQQVFHLIRYIAVANTWICSHSSARQYLRVDWVGAAVHISWLQQLWECTHRYKQQTNQHSSTQKTCWVIRIRHFVCCLCRCSKSHSHSCCSQLMSAAVDAWTALNVVSGQTVHTKMKLSLSVC